MKGNYIAHLFVVTVAFYLLTSVTFACTFVGGERPPCAVYPHAEVVFLGVVTEISEKRTLPNDSESIITATFLVEKEYKGNADKVVLIQTTSNMCDYRYEKGKRYLIYAARAFSDRFSTLRGTSIADDDRNRYAKDDFDFLQSVSGKKSTGSIRGFVYEWRSTPLKGIKITVEGNGKHHKVLTDAEGKFLISDVKPGVYKIRCTVSLLTEIAPSRKDMRFYGSKRNRIAEVEETVVNHGCSYTEFELWLPKGRKSNATRK
jgi:hypothetical protein